ncbi:zinc finger protein 687-like isoform X2 [Anthonomus grandis grandis]|uniref:zinc finger protein 687-like isoform X2 n=2 Tax=Anthonomus grandis grandis TaxID=2921223 RepID=UPI0021656C2F|nr:zinc finger protein 687-like isoform X2 [Anthonomus grandis grandis]
MSPDCCGVSGVQETPRNALEKKFDLLFDKDPKEWIAFKPALGLHVYPCYSCRHMFYTKKSFQDHVNRRTILLQYKCPKCKLDEPMLFYNRCSILLHCRKHFTLKEGQIDFSHLEIKFLPFGLAGFVRHPDVPYLFDVVEELITGDLFMNSQFYTPKLEDRGKEVITLTPSHLVINRTDENGESQGLALKQIAKNIPKCLFITIDSLRHLRFQIETPEVEIKSESEETSSSYSDQIVFSDEAAVLSEKSQEEVTPLSSLLSNVHEQTDALPVISKVETVDEEFLNRLPPVQPGNQPDKVLPTSISKKCTECQLEFADLLQHFMGPNRPTSENLRCACCKLVCPTVCSYEAHLRIHDKESPFVCPDCGVSFTERDELKEHMDTVCFHELKSVRYRCPGRRCGRIFASDATFRPHFRDSHIERLFACSYCMDPFNSLESCKEHLIIHKNDTTELLGVLEIFRCSVCNGENMNQHQLLKHLDGHCNDLSRCIYIYMCKFCKCYFRSVQTITTHLKNCKQKKAAGDSQGRQRTSNNFLLSKYHSTKCLSCKAKMITLKSRSVSYCSVCQPKNVKCKVSSQPIQPTPPDRCVCILCKAHLKFVDRRKHQHSCRYSRPQVVLERLSLDTLKKETVVREYFKLENKTEFNSQELFHLQKPLVLIIETGNADGTVSMKPEQTYACLPDIGKMKIPEDQRSTSSSELDSPQKRPKSTSSEESRTCKKTHSDSSDDVRPRKRPRSSGKSKKSDLEEDLTADQPISFDGTYICRICEQKETDRGKFHQHIKTHRQVSTAYQCMECGECFVVRPSLVKHLLHYHNISDFDCYFDQNNCFDQSAVNELAKVMKAPFLANDVKENQCKVCMEQFEDKESLDRHFRVHGMAFLITKSL